MDEFISTSIKTLDSDDEILSNVNVDNLPDTIMDLSFDEDVRLKALEQHYDLVGHEAIEIVSKLTGMYQFSGTRIIQEFLYSICTISSLPTFFKLEAANSLLSFEECDYDSDNSENTQSEIKTRNIKRKKYAYVALDCVCSNLSDIPTPCKVESIFNLMHSEDFMDNSDTYFRQFIGDNSINCDYRYKTILSLANKDVINRDYFVKNANMDFLENSENMTMYRILAAQKLLLDNNEYIEKICKYVLQFATDTELDYNLRADAADLLLGLGTPEMKILGRDIIIKLGGEFGTVKTVFDNAQNVHSADIEESVAETLEYLATFPTMKVNDSDIKFEFIKEQIETILISEKKNLHKPNKKHLKKCCNHCPICKKCIIRKKDECCSEACTIVQDRHSKIIISLNRIFIDRMLYSQFNNTLVNILIKVWSYIDSNECKDEIIKRLLEELYDMSGTCSTGFASRLVNVMSGFDGFNIRISWEDQIVANISGKLNTLAQTITSPDSIFMTKKAEQIVSVYLTENESLTNELISTIQARTSGEHDVKYTNNDESKEFKHVNEQSVKYEEKIPSMNEIVAEYLSNNRKEKIADCVELFSENVLVEMTYNTFEWEKRANFLLFFRSVFSDIKEEIYEDFKEFLSDADVDLYTRKAIEIYEGAS